MKSKWQRTALKATCLYFFSAVAWILGTDLALGLIKGASPDYTALGVAKGLCFVAVTSTLLYWILARNLRREHELRVRAEATAAELMDLKIIAEHSGEVFYKHDLQHRFIYVNSRARVLLGYDTDGQGVQWTEVATGNPVNQEAMRATERAIQTGQRQPPFLVELSKKDGSTILFEVEESPMKDAQGKVIAIAGAARDVTAREKAQQALRESEEKFRQVAETIGDGILILESGKCCDCNGRALEILGTERTALMGRNPLEFSPERQPDGRQSLATAGQLIQRAAAGEPQCFKWQHRRADGTEFFAELNLRPFNLGQERLVLAVMRDITERIQAEEALRESEERLRALYTSMSEGLAVHQMLCDAAGKAVNYRILDINPAFETITGLSRNKVVGALVTEAYGVEQPPCLERYAAVAETGQAIRLEHYHAPMERHFAISAFSPRKGQFATVFADITKRKAAEREIFLLNKLYALLSQMNEAIVRITDPDKLLAEACRIAVEHGEFGLAWAGMLEPGGKQVRQVARAGHSETVARFDLVTANQEHGADPFAAALASGKGTVCMDLQEQVDGGKARDWALAFGQRSMMLLPFRVGGEVTGGLWIYSNTPGHFTALVTELMVEVAANLSFALDRIERNRERELEQRQMRLQHSALEAAANAIVITDHTGVIEWVNEAFTRLTGYNREEVIGKTPRLLRSGAHDTRFYARMWDSVLAGKVWQGTVTNRRKDGVLYEEEMTVTPVQASGGEVTHFVAIKQDITERKRLELQFLRA
ncbi:MAG TPA: PAS domain S-box protein, partial [Clostridia bacterium]|nr:PAS domain S-box protein [Clostridia bacterium]